MAEWYEAKKEILQSLYRYRVMSPQQLSILLGYQQASIYRVGSELQKQGWVSSVLLPFLKGNSKGYTLTLNGAKEAAYLCGEGDGFSARLWTDVPRQLEHSYGTNEFFVCLIKQSLNCPEEGLVEWMGTRDASNLYARFENNFKKMKMPIKPDGFGTYRYENCERLVFHLEYDTGSESLWRLQDKLWNYALHLRSSWGKKIDQVHVLVITRGASRVKHILDLWESLMEGPLFGEKTPLVYCACEEELKYQENGGLWLGIENNLVPLHQLTKLPPKQQQLPFLGKKQRIDCFGK